MNVLKTIDSALKSSAFLNLATVACGIAAVAEEEFAQGTTPHTIARVTLKVCIGLGIYSSTKRNTERK